MTTPDPGPVLQTLCSAWATLGDVPEAERELVTEEDLMWASEILWRLSGRRWRGGGCEETAVLRAWNGDWPYHRSWGVCGCWSAGQVVNGSWFPDPTWTGQHLAPIAIRLPRLAATVTEVRVDGAVFTDWLKRASAWIERTDGRAWDLCMDATEVDYTFGSPPPLSGKIAAVDLAIELAKWRIGDGACRLPQRMQSLTRQGISISFDNMEYLDKGRTGVYTVDLFLKSVNPRGRGQTGRVWSPDLEAMQARRMP